LLCLLAARDLPRVWGRFDHQRPADGVDQMILITALAMLAAVVLLIWLRDGRRPQRHFVSNSAAQLFRELCRAHGLNFSSRRLLKRLAAARGLASPAVLFVEPRHFDAAKLPACLQPAANDLHHLRARLFE
jgi:hypothetical protein